MLFVIFTSNTIKKLKSKKIGLMLKSEILENIFLLTVAIIDSWAL